MVASLAATSGGCGAVAWSRGRVDVAKVIGIGGIVQHLLDAAPDPASGFIFIEPDRTHNFANMAGSDFGRW